MLSRGRTFDLVCSSLASHVLDRTGNFYEAFSLVKGTITCQRDQSEVQMSSTGVVFARTRTNLTLFITDYFNRTRSYERHSLYNELSSWKSTA